MKHRLVSNTISLTFIQVANYIAPLIMLVHLASVLGPETYGILAFGQAIIVMSSMLIDLDIHYLQQIKYLDIEDALIMYP